jgi:hypothetical protein
MKDFIVRYVKALLQSVFVTIPLSFILTFFSWFFLKVITHLIETSFLDIWSATYVVFLFIFCAIDIFSASATLILIYRYIKPLGLSFQDSFDAYIKYDLDEEKPISEWTKEWVETRLHIRRLADSLASKMVDAFFKRHNK